MGPANLLHASAKDTGYNERSVLSHLTIQCLFYTGLGGHFCFYFPFFCDKFLQKKNLGEWQAIKAVPCRRWTPQECVLLLLLFIVYVRWIGKCSQAEECFTVGNCKISRLLFADDLVVPTYFDMNLASTEHYIAFADACNIAGTKISTAKTEVLLRSRNPF